MTTRLCFLQSGTLQNTDTVDSSFQQISTVKYYYRAGDRVVPLYCFDPDQYKGTHNFGFPRTAGPRAQFLLDSVAQLRAGLKGRGADLVVQHCRYYHII